MKLDKDIKGWIKLHVEYFEALSADERLEIYKVACKRIGRLKQENRWLCKLVDNLQGDIDKLTEKSDNDAKSTCTHVSEEGYWLLLKLRETLRKRVRDLKNSGVPEHKGRAIGYRDANTMLGACMELLTSGKLMLADAQTCKQKIDYTGECVERKHLGYRFLEWVRVPEGFDAVKPYKFECVECGKKKDTVAAMRRHIDNYHAGIKASDPADEVCKNCGEAKEPDGASICEKCIDACNEEFENILPEGEYTVTQRPDEKQEVVELAGGISKTFSV